MANDQRRRKNLSGDTFVYGSDEENPADPVGGFGSIFRTAIAASGTGSISGSAWVLTVTFVAAMRVLLASRHLRT